jgi:hypothetical protein
MIEKKVSFRALLKVEPDDVELLLQSARERDGRFKQLNTLPEALRSLCVWPAEAPADVGYVLDAGTEVTPLAEAGTYQLTVNATVRNEAGVVTAAQIAFFETWGDEEWVPEDLAEALFEMLLASNPNPSPSNLGFTVVDWCRLN